MSKTEFGKNVSFAVRTNQILQAYAKDGRSAKLDRFKIGEQPTTDGYSNLKLQKEGPGILADDLAKKGMLAGMGTWEYRVPDTDGNAPFKGGYIVHTTDDKRRIPKAYRESARYTLSMEKLRNAYGDAANDVYYGVNDRHAIEASSEKTVRSAFDRFVGKEVDIVTDYLEKDEAGKQFADKKDEIVALMKEQYEADFQNGDYLNYASAMIGQMPGGKEVEGKKKEAIKEQRDKKKEKTGLSNPVINYSMGGTISSPYAQNAGIMIVSYDADRKLASILRNQQEDMAVFAGDLIGAEEKPNQGVYVGKEVVSGNKAKVAVLYTGFESENKGEVDAAMKNVISQAIVSTTTDFTIEDQIYQPTESQVQNAIERYTPSTGSWVGKNINKPIKIELDESLVSEKEVSNEKQMGE